MHLDRMGSVAMRLLVGAVVVIAGVAGASASASAADSTCPIPVPLKPPAVTRTVGRGDATSCTEAALRAAVDAGGKVVFDCGAAPVTIGLSRALQVRRTTVVDGAGRITLDGRGRDRIFFVANSTTLSVRNLALVRGHAAEVEDRDRGAGGAIAGMYQVRVEILGSTLSDNVAGQGGGAVFVGTDSHLTITKSRFVRNRAWLGGAVYSLLSPLTVSDSVFEKNTTTNRGGHGDGGAIFTDGAAPRDVGRSEQIAICRTTIMDNRATGGGGGAFLWGYDGDRILVYRSQFLRNTVGTNSTGNRGLGGGARIGVATDGKRTGAIALSRVAFERNSSGGSGGALYLDCARPCSIQNATFAGNSTGGYGGAIYGDRHQDNNVTYAGNIAGGAGGAVAGKGIVFRNTILTGNWAKNPWRGSLACTDRNAGTAVLQWGVGGPDRSTPCVSGAIERDPKLASPAANGADVRTMMPALNSPVLGRGVGCVATDARSVVRPAVCDLGAAQRTR